MKPLIFDAVSACCEGMLLLTFLAIPAVPSRQRFTVLLTSGMACTRNIDEYLKGMHTNGGTVVQTCLAGQQLLKLGQQTAA